MGSRNSVRPHASSADRRRPRGRLESDRALAYWRTRTPAERVAAVEFLRRSFLGPGARLQRVLRVLNGHHVEFVVVGAHALAFHGAPRFTGDLDILVRPTLDNGRRLLSAIAASGFPTTTLTPDDIVAGNKVIAMGVVPVQIHVMSRIDGVTWEDV